MATTIDPVMRKFRAALDDAYGDRIERVVLFGSRARGDACPDSDWDVAVFLKGMEEFARDVKVVSGTGDDILRVDGAVIHALPLPEPRHWTASRAPMRIWPSVARSPRYPCRRRPRVALISPLSMQRKLSFLNARVKW